MVRNANIACLSGPIITRLEPPGAKRVVVARAVGGDDQVGIGRARTLALEQDLLELACAHVERADGVDPARVATIDEVESRPGWARLLCPLNLELARSGTWGELADGKGEERRRDGDPEHREHESVEAEPARFGGGQLGMPAHRTDRKDGGEEHRRRHDQEGILRN